MKTKLRLAIQKSGRLSSDSLKILREVGIEFDNETNSLKTHSTNFPLEIFFLRDDDIPLYVEKGFFNLGIVGKNVVIENNKDVNIVDHLGFSKCRLSIAVPNENAYYSIKCLENKSIATSYPYILSEYLKKNKITSDIHKISGSVEIAPSIGLADVICDLVNSGNTLRENGLREVETILDSEAVLISNMILPRTEQSILNELLFRLTSIKESSLVTTNY